MVFALEPDLLPVQGYTTLSAGVWAEAERSDPVFDRARLRLNRSDRAHDASDYVGDTGSDYLMTPRAKDLARCRKRAEREDLDFECTLRTLAEQLRAARPDLPGRQGKGR